jgi:hypothetical protein
MGKGAMFAFPESFDGLIVVYLGKVTKDLSAIAVLKKG